MNDGQWSSSFWPLRLGFFLNAPPLWVFSSFLPQRKEVPAGKDKPLRASNSVLSSGHFQRLLRFLKKKKKSGVFRRLNKCGCGDRKRSRCRRKVQTCKGYRSELKACAHMHALTSWLSSPVGPSQREGARPVTPSA